MNLLFCLPSFSNYWEEYRSVWDIKQARNALYIGVGITAFTTIFLEDTVIDQVQDEIPEKNRLGKYNLAIDYMGRWIPNLTYSMINSAAGHLTKDPNQTYSENAAVMLRASIYASLTSTLLKYIIRQKRPYGEEENSFPSGHTTTIFAFAGVIGERHSLVYSIPAYLLASAVAFQRINSNRHYLHDVLMGATIGISFGIGVSKFNKKNQNSPFSTSLLIRDNKPMGINLVYNF